MSKAEKITQLIGLNREMTDTVLPELLKLHQNFNPFEGASLSETKSNMKLIVSVLEKLIAENKLEDLSWNTLHALNSAVSGVLNVYAQFKHSLDQNGFQGFSGHVDSCLQQVQMYATPALFSNEYNLVQINSATDLLRDKLTRLEMQGNSIQSKIYEQLESAETEISNATRKFSESELLINEKKQAIDDLLDAASAKTIASNFDESANQEKTMADSFRYASIFLMLMIVVAFGVTLLETTTPNFNWINSLIKIGIAFSLSVPTAYLARESAKHRRQYYNHLQTSLDLKAIHPFLATLPKEDQHKIKAEIANKIFSPKDNSFLSKDSIPINIQELLMAILNLNKK